MKNKLIVLVQPMHGNWDKLFTRLPESLLAIAALPDQKGYDVKIIDQRVDTQWKIKLTSLIKKKPICCGITSLTGPSLKYAIEVAKIVKEMNADIPVVFGGVHATLLPEQTIQYKHFDILVKGEADYRFYDLVMALENHQAFDEIKGLCYKKNGSIVFTGEPSLIFDMENLPPTPYKLIDINKYSAIDLGTGKSISFPTSRGCPFACKFCANEVLQKSKWRGLSVERIVEKIKFFQNNHGINTFYFLDDCSSYRLAHLRKLTEALLSISPPVYWSTAGIRADLLSKLNQEDIDLLWKSGCRALEIGIESGSERIIKFIRKSETKDQMRMANEKLSNYPINVKYSNIIGFPTETVEEMNQTIDFNLELQKTNPHCYSLFFIYTPIIGTSLYNLSIEHGFKEPEQLDEWTKMDYKNWMYKYESWIGKDKRKTLEAIMIVSLFSNKNAKVKLTSGFPRLLFSLYHPIAKLRMKKKYFKMHFEIMLANKIFS